MHEGYILYRLSAEDESLPQHLTDLASGVTRLEHDFYKTLKNGVGFC